MSHGPRQRLVIAAIELVRERGVEGTGLSDLLARGHSARRSVYQHFSGGKSELVATATRAAGRWMQQGLHDLGAEGTAAAMMGDLLRQVAADLRGNDFTLGCPVMAAATSADADTIRKAAAEVFDQWSEEIARVLVRDGHPPEEARSLASFVVSSVEGALTRARAARSTAPLDEASTYLTRLVAI